MLSTRPRLRADHVGTALAALLLVAAPARASGPVGEDPSTDVAALTARLRQRTLPDEARRAAEDALLRAGPEAARALLAVLDERERDALAELEASLPPYLKRYGAAARKHLARQSSRHRQEIEDLRDVVNQLRGRAGLSYDDIASIGDPARRRLEEILSADNGALLEADERLAADREALLHRVFAIDGIRERRLECRYAVDPDADIEADEEAAQAGVDPFRMLEDSERREADLAVAVAKADRSVLEKNAAVADQLDPEEARGVRALNLLRIRLGLRALPVDVRLCAAARDHSKDMHELRFFSHTSPVEGKETPGQRAARFKTSAGAENIAAGERTGPGAIDGWWHSPGHMKNMLGGHGRVGLGRHETLWTQLFG